MSLEQDVGLGVGQGSSLVLDQQCLVMLQVGWVGHLESLKYLGEGHLGQQLDHFHDQKGRVPHACKILFL